MAATAPQGQPTDFFISYTAADRAWAEWIAWQLADAGYTVILQAWDFVPGRDFIHEMERATARAQRTIAVLSDSYAASEFGEAEWRAAFARDPAGEKGLLIPVKVMPCTPPGLLASRVYIDLTGKAAGEAREALLVGISRKGARPTSEPAFPGQISEPPMYPGGIALRHEPLDAHRGERIPVTTRTKHRSRQQRRPRWSLHGEPASHRSGSIDGFYRAP